MTTRQTATLEWRDAQVPISARFDDPYFSVTDGLAETHHVFLEGNALSERLCPGFHVAELGVGTGLNVLALWQLAKDLKISGIRYTGFEAFPLANTDITRALSHFPALGDLPRKWASLWDQRGFTWADETIEITVISGDARLTLPKTEFSADAWFLDGFSPAKNPELWEPALLKAVGQKTKEGGSCATYSAAGHVRRALQEAGFVVERTKGYGTKRHMTRGRKAETI